MRRITGLLLFAMSLPALVAASDFNGMVRAFSRQTGVTPMHIPFFGLARFVVAVAQPAGTSDLQLAVFEHVEGRQANFAQVADGVASGGGWNGMVRVREKRGAFTNIYMKRDGSHVRLLVATLDAGEAVFVEMRVKPEELMKFVDEHNGQLK